MTPVVKNRRWSDQISVTLIKTKSQLAESDAARGRRFLNGRFSAALQSPLSNRQNQTPFKFCTHSHGLLWQSIRHSDHPFTGAAGGQRGLRHNFPVVHDQCRTAGTFVFMTSSKADKTLLFPLNETHRWMFQTLFPHWSLSLKWL